MNRRKKIAMGAGLTILFGLTFAGIASAKGKKNDPSKGDDDPRRPRDRPKHCPDGMKWSDRLGRCVPIECPAGYVRQGNRVDGDCVLPDDPNVKFCPEGWHWDDETGQCVENDDPTACPPDQVFNLFTGSCRPKCGEGQYWSAADNKCLDINPKTPVDESCPPGFHWVGPRYGMPGRCVEDAPPDIDEPFIIDDYIKKYPEDGNFYLMKYGDIMGWGIGKNVLRTDAVTQNVLGRALFLAARVYGKLDDAAAMQWANARRRNPSLTNKIYNAILCCAWNDILYGTWGYCGDDAIENQRCPADMENHPGEHGRAIRPLTQHADNLERMKQGLEPSRIVSLGSPANKGDGHSHAVASAEPGGDNSYPALWLPGIDRKKLWDSNGKDLEFDTDRALPPDPIWNRGFDNASNSQLAAWGCNTAGYSGRVEL